MRALAVGLVILIALSLVWREAETPPSRELTRAISPARMDETPPRPAPAPEVVASGPPTRESAPGVAATQAPASELPVTAPLPPRENRRAVPHVSLAAADASASRRAARAEEQLEEIASVLQSPEFESAMAPVARLYLAYFGRLPDFEGFQYYIDERDGGRTLDKIADEFAGSREFELRYGQVDNAGFLDRMAGNVSPGGLQPAERAFWLAQLESGAVTRGQVMLALSESHGFRGATDNEVFVAIAYGEILRRAPDVSDRSRWVAFLDAGNPRAALIAELLAPPPRATP